MTASWVIHVIEYARSHAQPVASIVLGAHDAGVVDLPFAFVAARSPHGVLLIDTGFCDEAGGHDMAVRFDIPTIVSPLRMLAAIGIAPADVTDIILSHAHFDHMGAVRHFPNARIHMQKRELLSWVEALALPARFGFLTEAIDPDDLRAALDAAVQHRLHLLDGDTDHVLPGVHVRLAADSHTLGSQWVLFDRPDGPLVIAGDCIYSYQNLAGARADRMHRPLGFGVGSVWEQLRAMDRISEAVAGDLDRIVLLHDTARWRQFETVTEIDGMRILHATLGADQ